MISMQSNLLFKQILPLGEQLSNAARHEEPLSITGIEALG
jgi:hypothetical protein